MSKQSSPASTASAIGLSPTLIQISRTLRHWNFTQHHRTTRPSPHTNLKKTQSPMITTILTGSLKLVDKDKKTAFQDKIENAETSKDNAFIYVVIALFTGRSFGLKHAETLTRLLKAHLRGELNERVAELTKLGTIFQIRQGLLNTVKSFN